MISKGRHIFFIMGVSGCGKSTIGKLLAKELSIPFFDGDDYHSKANVQKMADGQPLNDSDREGWLIRLNELAKENIKQGTVIACSSLKEQYRNVLSCAIEDVVIWVYLKGSFDEIQKRLQQRKGHFMPTGLLRSQFETLEVPSKAITIPISKSPDEIVKLVKNELREQKKHPK